MNRSLQYALIAVTLSYCAAGWAIGYYFANPDMVTSAFWQMLLNPFGVVRAASDYGIELQIATTVIGPIILGVVWITFIVCNLIFGLKTLFLLFAGMGTLFVN